MLYFFVTCPLFVAHEATRGGRNAHGAMQAKGRSAQTNDDGNPLISQVVLAQYIASCIIIVSFAFGRNSSYTHFVLIFFQRPNK